MKITEEEYREAYLLWRKEHSQKESIPKSLVIELPSGRKVYLSRRINTMKSIYRAMQREEHYGNNCDLTEEQIDWWIKQGVNLTSEPRKRVRCTEEEYRKAYLLWREKNPKEINVPRGTVVELSNGKKVSLGKRITTMECVYGAMQEGERYQGNKELTSEQIAWWMEHGVDLRKRRLSKEEMYREAYLIWKKENPTEEDVPRSVVVPLSSGVEVKLGIRVESMMQIYGHMQEGKSLQSCNDLTEEQIDWWKSNGLNLDKERRTVTTEEEYREAYLFWKEQNPTKKNVGYREVVILPNKKEISLGDKITLMKSIYDAMQEGKHYGSCKDLTEEKILWWTDHGVDLNVKMVARVEVYREAYLLLKKENPRKRTVPQSTVVELPSGKNVPLGSRIPIMKLIYRAMKEGQHFCEYKDLTEEQIAWWENHGLRFESFKKRLEVRDVLKTFNIDLEELINILGIVHEKESIEIPKNMEKQTLKSLCINHGYNYDIVNQAMKLHKMLPSNSLEQLLRYTLNIKKNKKGISSWVYDDYGFFIEQILLELDLNASKILRTMSKDIIPLEKAICNQVFSKLQKKKDYVFLKSLYQEVIEKINFQETEEENARNIVQELIKIGENNHLEDSEKEMLKNSLFEYLRIIRGYQVLDVCLEIDLDKRNQKIKEYNLTEEELAQAEKIHSNRRTFVKKMVYY